jgi:hypothetical protein
LAGRRNEALPVERSMRLVVGDYILDYDLVDGVVAITAIRHGRQLDPYLAKDDDFDFEADPSASTSSIKP